MIPTRQQLEDGRNRGFIKYDYFWSFCELNKSCEQCDKTIRIGCVMKRKIEEFQTKRILRICKPEPPKGEDDSTLRARMGEIGGVIKFAKLLKEGDKKDE